MSNTYKTLATVPDLNVHREEIDTADTLPITDESLAVNGMTYDEGIATVKVERVAGVPAAAVATIEVLYWSDTAGAFVSESVPLAYTLVEDTSTQIRYPIEGRKFFIAVTAIAADLEVTIEIAAAPAV